MVKSLDEFHIRRSSKDGHGPRCKPCQIADVLATIDPERVRRYARHYYDTHREERQSYSLARYHAMSVERARRKSG